MAERPALHKDMKSTEFRAYYYLKEELAAFCRENGLPASGAKSDLTERIAHFLDTGEILQPKKAQTRRKPDIAAPLTPDSIIEENFVCSERHRAFFRQEIGEGFTFLVPFQKWLKANAGKTYREAAEAYRQIAAEKKQTRTQIDSQFEYNTYIRDFFADNPGRTLAEAIACWKFKKSRRGHNRYEREDLKAIE